QEETHISSDLNFDILITKETREILVVGTIAFNLHTICARCLVDVDIAISPKVHLILTPKVQFKEDLDYDSEIDYGSYEGDEIEIDDYLREVVALGLPMKVLCREDCKGLCPLCGANLNLGECSCPDKGTYSRFEVLKGLKIS
ncbi:MAG: DUF177 domain-containing protein, partial [Candidatus Caldarchaeum sp.]